MLLRNRYRIIQPLGSGGFGKTYLAEDTDKLDERCVVKQLAPQVQGSSALQKATDLFKQEARRLQHLGEHSQIPTLYAYFEEDKRLYLVQQLIQGQNLLQELEQQGAFNEQGIREVVSDLLPILQFVHRQQVIHRDIKPENIIRRHSDGKLVLIDFGIAKLATATVMSKTGTRIGSFGYAPREQMNGGEAYPASDLYSLGTTCFHLLTEIAPWQLETDQGYGWVLDWQQHLNNPISQKLDFVLTRLLQKDILERYPSVEAVLEDLKHQPSPLQLIRPTVVKNYQQPPQPAVPFTVPPSPQPSPRSPIASVKQNGKFKNILLMGSAILLLGLVGTQIYGYLRYRLFPSNPIFLITSLPSSIFLERSLLDSYWVNCVAISPDKQTLVSGTQDGTIKIWNLSKGTRRITLKGNSSAIGSVAISPDGQTLVSGTQDGTIKIWNLSKGTQRITLKGHYNWVRSVAISPDGQTLVSGSKDKTIKIWNLSNGKLRSTLTVHSGEVNSVAISPDGQTLVSGNGDKTIKIWNLSTSTLRSTLKGHSGEVNSVAISPDGQTLVSASADKTIKAWNLNNGKQRSTLTGNYHPVYSVAISSDGQSLVSSSGNTIKIWNLSNGSRKITLYGHSYSVKSVAISPDRETLVSGSTDKTIKIWRVPK